MIPPFRLRWLALAAAGLTLSGCVTVFPKAIPAQLYRFAVAAPATPAPPLSAAPVSVIRAPTSFPRGADGDQILTTNGDQAAYIAGARWIAPAASLFDEAESQAFDQAAVHVRLARRGEYLSAPYSLKVDVSAFEARYLGGPTAPPTIVVRVEAILVRISDRKVIAATPFESQKPAADNRVNAIVPAFDAAVSDVLGQVVAWTDAQASATPLS